MSSHSNEHAIVCPNCGSAATGNYCSQCGQATHLHKDTFWGLVTHFIAHYFHFESKFWQTMRTLMARPGVLTVAYLNKQRARYVPPMSLYIFVAVVFFLLSSLIEKGYQKLGWIPTDDPFIVQPAPPDTVRADTRPIKGAALWFRTLGERMEAAGRNPEYERAITGYIPKVFFLMIPVLAGIIRLLLLRNPRSRFVTNSIFALHLQAASFILQLLEVLLPFIPSLLTFLVSVIYLALALRRVYSLTTGRAIIVGLIASLLYLLVLFAAVLSLALIVASSVHN